MAYPRTILITGGAGNLGGKLAAHLSTQPWCERIVLLDITAPVMLPAKADALAGDLLDPGGSWRQAAAEADAIVHFAALNPYPDASFAEAAASFDMTANLFLAAAGHESRVVFASSNHVMGRYKEEAPEAGTLGADLPPLPGTRFIQNGILNDAPAYATAKLMGERLLVAEASRTESGLTGVALRVGWCQPGANRPQTITGDGLPADAPRAVAAGDARRDLTWFRNMWLSNRDFCAVFTAALTADAAEWPRSALVLNAMSANRGMAWDLRPTRRYLGYAPQDDVWAELD